MMNHGRYGTLSAILHRHAVRVSGGQYNEIDMYAADSSRKRLPRRKRLAMTEKATLLVIAMKSFVGWGHVPALQRDGEMFMPARR